MANYDTVKNGIVARLKAQGFAESDQAVDFKNAPANEYGNRFIIKCLTGENIENTIIDRFEDKQVWQILIAFTRSDKNDIVSLDAMHRKKDAIIKDIDKPSNWAGVVKILKYASWSVLEFPNYYVLDIRLDVIDEYIHN